MKIVLWVVGVIIFLVITMAVSFGRIISESNRPRGNHEEVLKSSLPSPKKALVVYQPSSSDMSSRMAHKIASGINSEGYEVILNYPGDHLPTTVSEFDVVVFGSAVYAGQPSKLLVDYISKIRVGSNCKVALYSTGSVKEELELDNMEKTLKDAKAYRKIKFNVNEKSENDIKAYNFGQELAKE